MASKSKPHVVVFPFMAQGHTLPLLDLSKSLSNRGVKVTIITTPSNIPSIAHCIADHHPNITLTHIPFPPTNGLPKGCENTTQLPSMDLLFPFLQATKHLQIPFEKLLQHMSDTDTLPICVISDFFLGWTLPSCQAFGVPRLVFHGMGILSMAISKIAWDEVTNSGTISNSDPLKLPSLLF